jgi:ABC-type nitrate/sulfonate/bicarbonate transport system permease component
MEFVQDNFAALLGLLLGVVVGIPSGVMLTLHKIRGGDERPKR